MTETSTLGFLQAAQVLGVSIGSLRSAIRQGKIPAPEGKITAVSTVSPEWLKNAQQAAKSGDVFKHSEPQKAPAFARYEGTSAWRKFHTRVRAYNLDRAAK